MECFMVAAVVAVVCLIIGFVAGVVHIGNIVIKREREASRLDFMDGLKKIKDFANGLHR